MLNHMNSADPLAQPETGQPGAKRASSGFDAPTAEKRAIGVRLRNAREIAGLALTDAAKHLGYSQPVQLCNMEGGSRMPSVRVLRDLSLLYGTTVDYLLGLVEDSDRDPAVAAHAVIARRLTAECRGLIAAVSAAGVHVVRELRPDAGLMQRIAESVVQAHAALVQVRGFEAGFDDLRGGARLLAQLDTAAALARHHLNHVARAKRKLAGGHAQLFELALDDVDARCAELPPGLNVGPMKPLNARELAEDERIEADLEVR